MYFSEWRQNSEDFFQEKNPYRYNRLEEQNNEAD